MLMLLKPILQQRIRYYLGAAGLVFGLQLGSCVGVNRQPEQGRIFKSCTFRLQAIEEATLVGVDVREVRVAADLSAAGRARIVAAYTAGALPLHMRLALEVANPNPEVAVLNTLSYRVRLDGHEVATGATIQRLEVPANSTVVVQVPVNTDVRPFIRNSRPGAVGDFALGLTDRQRQRRRLHLAVRPSVRFLGTLIQSPDYLTVDQDVSAEELLEQRNAQPDSIEVLRR